MTDRPILFSAPMVRALLSGAKTQTRRLMKPQPADDIRLHRFPNESHAWISSFGHKYGRQTAHSCPQGRAGDSLWVRESWQTHCDKDGITPRDLPPETDVQYPATYEHWVSKRRPGIHMPRWASRITLQITDVRVQKVKDITEEDAKAEGVRPMRDGGGTYVGREGPGNLVTPWPSAKEAFADLWDSINGAGAFEADSWVWAISFSVIRSNIDKIAREAA